MTRFLEWLEWRRTVPLPEYLRRDMGLPRRPEPGPAWWQHL